MDSLIGGDQIRKLIELTADLKVEGEIWECGVFKGGSARIMHDIQPDRTLRLFDTFGKGIPVKSEVDSHQIGDFSISDAEYLAILNYFGSKPNVTLHKGVIPDTFTKELNDCKIALLHIDLDQYESYTKTLEFCTDRMVKGGVIVFDDYIALKGATKAVDEFIEKTKYKLNTHPTAPGGYNWGAWVFIE